jgi:glycosyltransferase involved in cell wall biosynthesis
MGKPRQHRQPSQPTPAQKKAQLTNKMRMNLAAKKGEQQICLTMIVKNESKNMVRLLDSVHSIINMASIVDTGSTDNTEEVIMQWSNAHKLPITVHHEPFRNFSFNRTHSVQMARKTYPEADYLLLSDADFVWMIDVGNKFDKRLLVDHKYLIEQKNNTLTYANVRMLSSRVDWVCVGRTHEYWKEAKDQKTYGGEIRTTKIKTLTIDDREDGGCKDDKFVRDERLLREGLDDPEEPADVKTRYKFYLAQTLKDLQRHHESISWYHERIKDGGWAEEVYYAYFQIGFNYEQLAWKYKTCAGLVNKLPSTPGTYEKIEEWNPRRQHHHTVLHNLKAVKTFLKLKERTPQQEQDIKNVIPAGKAPEDMDEIINLLERNELVPSENEFLAKWNPEGLGETVLLSKADENYMEAGVYYTKAHTYRKTRAESLYYACVMYRKLGLNEQSLNVGLVGRAIKYPAQDSLFIEYACYDYLFDAEIAITAFYVAGKNEIGRDAAARLLARDDLPEHVKTLAMTNSRHYI